MLLADLWNARKICVAIRMEILTMSNATRIKSYSELLPELSLKRPCSCCYYAQDAEDGPDYRHMLGWMQRWCAQILLHVNLRNTLQPCDRWGDMTCLLCEATITDVSPISRALTGATWSRWAQISMQLVLGSQRSLLGSVGTEAGLQSPQLVLSFVGLWHCRTYSVGTPSALYRSLCSHQSLKSTSLMLQDVDLGDREWHKNFNIWQMQSLNTNTGGKNKTLYQKIQPFLNWRSADCTYDAVKCANMLETRPDTLLLDQSSVLAQIKLYLLDLWNNIQASSLGQISTC